MLFVVFHRQGIDKANPRKCQTGLLFHPWQLVNDAERQRMLASLPQTSFKQARHIINADVLKALGPRGHVVNISRGWAVDESAVAQALRSGVIEGAALDVFDEEPYTGTELLGLDNLVMTPHFGGGTEHAQRRMTALVCRNLDNHFAGKPVVSPVPELRDMAANTQGRLR
mgnify:CR=1 FL=1